MYRILKSYAADLLSLFFPELCAGCGQSLVRNEEYICTDCIYKLPYTYFSEHPDNTIEKQFWGRIELVQAAAYLHFSKGTRVQSMMHQLKYNNQPSLGNKLGTMYASELKQAARWVMPDIIVPVPLHRKKLRSRGYNQSEHIALGLAEALGIPILTDALRRPEITESQTRKSRFARFENMQHAFTLSSLVNLNGKHVLLVDDVMTTGATLEACAACILSGCDAKISVATIAYTD